MMISPIFCHRARNPAGPFPCGAGGVTYGAMTMTGRRSATWFAATRAVRDEPPGVDAQPGVHIRGVRRAAGDRHLQYLVGADALAMPISVN